MAGPLLGCFKKMSTPLLECFFPKWRRADFLNGGPLAWVFFLNSGSLAWADFLNVGPLLGCVVPKWRIFCLCCFLNGGSLTWVFLSKWCLPWGTQNCNICFPKGLDCFWALKSCFQGPLRGRGSPLEGPGVCIGGAMTLRVVCFLK